MAIKFIATGFLYKPIPDEYLEIELVPTIDGHLIDYHSKKPISNLKSMTVEYAADSLPHVMAELIVFPDKLKD